MKPEQQRIGIAEACGWKDIRSQRLHGGDQDSWGNKLTNFDNHRNRLPDYLNAMHEAEKVLSSLNTHDYWLHLLAMNEYIPAFGGTASASVRAEAFLRTIGKWEDDK